MSPKHYGPRGSGSREKTWSSEWDRMIQLKRDKGPYLGDNSSLTRGGQGFVYGTTKYTREFFVNDFGTKYTVRDTTRTSLYATSKQKFLECQIPYSHVSVRALHSWLARVTWTPGSFPLLTHTHHPPLHITPSPVPVEVSSPVDSTSNL